MAHIFAQSVEILTTILAVAGMGYFLAAVVAARVFLTERSGPLAEFAPGVSVLKSLKGLDPGMMDAFRSHCRQSYAGEFELLFGVASLDDPAMEAVRQLQAEFPGRSIRLIECPERLGTNGKVSTLIQLASHAKYDFLLINDSDITVSPRYLERVMGCFGPAATPAGAKARADFAALTARLKSCPDTNQRFSANSNAPDDLAGSVVGVKTPTCQFVPFNGGSSSSIPAQEVGLVTTLYRGRAHGTLPSRLEALGIATDFQAGVLLSKWIEGGLHYGLGSTLAVRREALDKIGGLQVLVDHLADDYELGARVAGAGYGVVLSAEVVETNIAAYGWRGFVDHQLRWERAVRDSRPWGYAGLIFTHGLGWALLNVLASGASPLSLWLLGLSFFLRLTLAMTVGAEVLGDRQVLPRLWLVPLRDLVAMGVWVAGFAGNTIVWRGERFALKDGKLHKAGEPASQRVSKSAS
jgi:ceramide glucosyltransferase